MGSFLVSMTLESKITIVKCFIRLTTGFVYFQLKRLALPSNN